MLYRANNLIGHHLDSLNGEIGKVKDVFFDDSYWTVRYLVVDTGSWLSDRKVVVTPQVLGPVEAGKNLIRVKLTKKEIEECPALDGASPISRDYEQDYYRFFGLPVYWSGSHMWGNYPYMVQTRESWNDTADAIEHDFHLRSTQDVVGRHIQASDGEIGHVADFILDDENWAIRYLVVDTRNWWPGKKVLLAPQWIDHMSWDSEKVLVNVSRVAIQEAPEYRDDTLITRAYENDLHRHYERRGYWMDESTHQMHAS